MKFVVLSMVLLFAVGGCAKEPDGEGVATVGGASAQQSGTPEKPADNPDERARQLVACIRANGVNVRDPEPGDQGGKTSMNFDSAEGDKAKFVAALEKCRIYMPAGGENGRATPEQIENLRRFAQCMRDNGVANWPDPDAE